MLGVQLSIASAERQEAGVGMRDKRENEGLRAAEECRDFLRRAIAELDPNDLGWEATPDAESLKVLVLGDDDRVFIAPELPDLFIRGGGPEHLSGVLRAGKDVSELVDPPCRQVLVEQQAGGTGRFVRRPESA